MRGLSAKAPSSAHFSTSQSLLLADKVVQATATSHLGPEKGTCSEALVTLRDHLAAEYKHTTLFSKLDPAASLQRCTLRKHKQLHQAAARMVLKTTIMPAVVELSTSRWRCSACHEQERQLPACPVHRISPLQCLQQV